MSRGDRRVVFVTQRFPPDKGGNASRIHDLATNLEDWSATVLAPPPTYPPGEFDRSWRRKWTDAVEDVTVHRLWTWQPQTEDPGMKRRLAYYLPFGVHAAAWLVRNARRYDAVVTTTPPISTGAPGLVASALGKPWIVDVRDLWIDASVALDYLEEGGTVEQLSRRFQRLVLHAADRIAITTETTGEALQAEYGRSLGEKTVVLPNGVDTDWFSPPPTSGPEGDPSASASDGVPAHDGATPATTDGGRAEVVYTGNLGTAQDLESVVRAMAHLSGDDVVLRLVGSGDVESRLRELAADLGVEDRVRFEGLVPRDEVPGILRDATVGVAPLRDGDELAYAMPTKVYEYMACGLPTIVTGRGEIERFVEASGGGLHVANDPERIADAIERLVGDPQLRDRLGADGREYVRERYDRAAIARRLGEELDAIAEGTA